MKKITLLITLMITSLGFSQQVLIENFETPANYTFAGFEGLGSASIAADPAVGGTHLNGLKLVSASTGNAWQGAEVILQNSKIKLTTNKTVKVDVYATQAFTMLAKVETGGAASATAQSYTTPGSWQTLTFTFTDGLDGTVTADGEYSKIVFFPNWNGNFGTAPANFTAYVDNITAEKTVVTPPSNQVVVENFETPANYTFAGFEGLGSAAIAADPAAGGTNLNGLKLVSVSTGNAWQGAEVVLQNSKIKLTTDKTVKVDVYATQAFTMLSKVEIGGAASATAQSYTTPGSWQTLTFTFTDGLDGTAAANGEYSKIVFFPNWNGNFATAPTNFTIYVDNITAEKAVATPAFVPGVAPTPSTPNADVLSIYGDTGGFTNKWTKDYSFGGYVAKLDLDTTASVNEAIKMDFSVVGYGEGKNSSIDISAYNWVHFDYYVDPAMTAGVNGDQVRFILIGGGSEYNYEMTTAGSDGTLVKGSWQSVNVPLSVFTAKGFNKSNFLQFKLGSASDLNSKVVFFDNIYFSKTAGTVLGTANFEKSGISVYPNPASTSLTIQANSTIEKVSIYNLLGQEVISKNPKANDTTLDISSLQKGAYIVKTSSEGKTETTKVLKK